MQISVIGTGYVGLVTGVCLAEIGHRVWCIDNQEQKIAQLRDQIVPFYEPGLRAIMQRTHARLNFSANIKDGLTSEVIFVAVGTPALENGKSDISAINAVINEIAWNISQSSLVVIKSTVPVKTCEKLATNIQNILNKRQKTYKIEVISNPEFLREGSAVHDFMNPDRIIIGLDKTSSAKQTITNVYKPLIKHDLNKLIFVSLRASELSKLAANGMLAARISYMNELAILCAELDIDIREIQNNMGKDKRIGPYFLEAGPGYGGSCFPKDISSLINIAEENQCYLGVLEAVQKANFRQKQILVNQIKQTINITKENRKTLSFWGLSFKPDTDDIRESPAIYVIKELIATGFKIKAHDPKAGENFSQELTAEELESFQLVHDPYQALIESNALILLTAWTQYKWPDWQKFSVMSEKVIFDCLQMYDADLLKTNGYVYHRIKNHRL